jgi:hypothetical protein
VSVLLGNGDGTFQTAATFGSGSGAGSVAVGDLNRDGQTDLAVAGGTVSVLLNNTAQMFEQVAMPTFSPPGGTYDQPPTVTLSDATSGSTIYYTTDGSTPATSSAVYANPIPVTQTTTIRARATAIGMINSKADSATYTLVAAAPTFSPPGGKYLLPQFVSIADASPGMTIYYTTDGSTPTTSSNVYNGRILVLTTTTIKAIAVAPGWYRSSVATTRYRIGL